METAGFLRVSIRDISSAVALFSSMLFSSMLVDLVSDFTASKAPRAMRTSASKLLPEVLVLPDTKSKQKESQKR